MIKVESAAHNTINLRAIDIDRDKRTNRMKGTTRKKKSRPQPQSKKTTRSNSSYVSSIAVGVTACWIGFYISYFLSSPSEIVVSVDYTERKNFNITCSEDYKNYPAFDQCTPTKVCGRVIYDNIVSEDEVDKLLDIAKRGFVHGGSGGGASILDLHSGALSMGEKFVNIFKYLDKEALEKTFGVDDFNFYSKIKTRVHETIADEYGIHPSKLHLTHPTFFSQITNVTAKTQHDEYWHEHIDKIQYGSFDYTSLLYLTDYGKDFTGGRFIFDGKNNITVEPRKGRLSCFTSGSENPHHVEKVLTGVRYAITISFTCDPERAIKDPKLQR